MSLKSTLTRSRLALGALAGSLLLVNSAQAANENVSASLSFDLNSHFMSYGVNVWGAATEDIGDEFLFQPSASVSFALNEGSAIYAGIWADINDLGASSIGRNVQEVDVWLGYYFTAGKFKFDFTLQSWMYSGENEGIFDITVSYDTMFAPYIKAHNRIEANGGQDKGTMFEIGATLYETTVGPVSLSVPVAVGFSLDDYHVAGEDGYAYSLVGVKFSVPLGIPDSYGTWDLHGGLTYYHTDKDATGNAESGYLTAGVGVGVSF